MTAGWVVARFPTRATAEAFEDEAAARRAYAALWQERDRAANVALLWAESADPAAWQPLLAEATTSGAIPTGLRLLDINGMRAPAGLNSLPR